MGVTMLHSAYQGEKSCFSKMCSPVRPKLSWFLLYSSFFLKKQTNKQKTAQHNTDKALD